MQKNITSATHGHLYTDDTLQKAIHCKNIPLVRLLLITRLNDLRYSTHYFERILAQLGEVLPEIFTPTSDEHPSPPLETNQAGWDLVYFRRALIQLREDFTLPHFKHLLQVRIAVCDEDNPCVGGVVDDVYQAIQQHDTIQGQNEPTHGEQAATSPPTNPSDSTDDDDNADASGKGAIALAADAGSGQTATQTKTSRPKLLLLLAVAITLIVLLTLTVYQR